MSHSISSAAQRSQESRARRVARYESVHALHEQGISIREIAHRLQLGRRTVRRILRASSFPERAKGPRRKRKLDPYLPWLEQRWEAGFRNGQALFRELKARGFTGSRAQVGKHVATLRRLLPNADRLAEGTPAALAARKTMAAPTAREVSWWIFKDNSELSAPQKQFLQSISSVNIAVGQVMDLARRFVAMARKRTPEKLEGWLENVQWPGLSSSYAA